MFRNRTTGEFLVLLVGITVCGYVAISGTLLAILLIFRPGGDYGELGRHLSDLINTLIGLLAGFLAGRTDTALIKHELENTYREKEKEALKEASRI